MQPLFGRLLTLIMAVGPGVPEGLGARRAVTVFFMVCMNSSSLTTPSPSRSASSITSVVMDISVFFTSACTMMFISASAPFMSFGLSGPAGGPSASLHCLSTVQWAPEHCRYFSQVLIAESWLISLTERCWSFSQVLIAESQRISLSLFVLAVFGVSGGLRGLRRRGSYGQSE